ncbi:MAG: chemotaxis protein CheX [Lachnospiraceae bacterium]|jgi:hypothetical protein|nr:chemotaxis protein CheX [Lachnospiraceae bacterium]
MFDQIFGRYLVDSERLTQSQLDEVIEYETGVRVKLGLLAVAEKLMTQEQAEEVNKLQAIMDKRFGDIAIMKGYLTEENVMHLLKKQDDIYMLFCQTLVDKGFMELEQIDEALSDYQSMEGFTHSDMDNLVSGNIDRTIQVFLPDLSALYGELCSVAVRTILRIIDNKAYVSKAYIVNELQTDKLAVQRMDGDHSTISGFTGAGNSLLTLADTFADEDFGMVDLDALDAVGEFTNCINGLLASDLSHRKINVDMLPPEFYDQPVTIKGEKICVFPVTIKEQTINFILAVDSDITIE